jgi:DNA-binding NarL/FixJ family response regulator
LGKTSIYIADDHQILIDGLIAFLQNIEGINVVGYANDGHMLLRELNNLNPDIILLDLNMPKLDGIKTLEKIVKDFPRIKVIILSNYNQTQLIKQTQKIGAKGYLLKNGSKNELLDAIEQVRNGFEYFSIKEVANEEVTAKFGDNFKLKYQLTKREVEIIQLVSKGSSSIEIADKLFITENTVNTHRRNILYKIDVKNVAGLIAFARDNGLI